MDVHDLGFEHISMTPEQEQDLADTIWKQDNVELTTVGVDVGSSTSHLMFSKVHLQRLAEGLSSRFVVVNRQVLWRSPILLTPYRSDYTIDAEELKDFFGNAYKDADLTPEDIDTGAVILTGEALKRNNARAIADLFAEESGKFVCASAGHNLEALMAANGSGAVALSRQNHQTILNIDVGGGTVKLGLCHGGRLMATSAFAVGGRLIAFDDDGKMTRIEGPAEQVADDVGVSLKLGDTLTKENRKKIVSRMVDVIVSYATRNPTDDLCKALLLTETLPTKPSIDGITFSGGVSEYIYRREEEDRGDLGKSIAHDLRHALADKRIPETVYDPGHGIRATVVGASQFTVQVSGNTIFLSQKEKLPVRNVPVASLDIDLSGDFTANDVSTKISEALKRLDMIEGEDRVAIAFRWGGDPLHARLYALAQGIHQGLPKTVEDPELPVVIMMDGDAGRTIGNILVKELNVEGEVISVDNVQLRDFDFVDIGEFMPDTQVVPLIIKSLLFTGPDQA
ncbi:MAG: ethanolamine ammonia-lyase reactivating factor EutA [Pseudomonadota bacterium]|nr:ethanolamine ammonia-lyase reactivating factor EutA [Pseudomonadota bacterium]